MHSSLLLYLLLPSRFHLELLAGQRQGVISRRRFAGQTTRPLNLIFLIFGQQACHVIPRRMVHLKRGGTGLVWALRRATAPF